MPNTIPASTLEKFTTFGDLLCFLRRRAGITQLEFSIAVGYSDSQISRLEQNLRQPDPLMIEARFIPALYLQDEPEAVRRLLDLAATLRLEDAPALGRCPYKGLDYFGEADADLFVGREALTEKITHQVISLVADQDTQHCRLFAVIGASGSGKSSLVRAGVIPAIRKNEVSSNWSIQALNPTAHPLESLAIALEGDASLANAASLIDDLAREQRTLDLYFKRKQKNATRSSFLLVIDQFEEVFAQCRSEVERAGFINNLMTAASTLDGLAVVLIILRADFYAHCAHYPVLREALTAHQEYIGAMRDEEIRRAIEEPAQRGHWGFEPGLVELILHDVGHEPGALPLLSHALLETWRRRHGHTMALSGYTSAGGVRGAIAETAEAVYTDRFSHSQQAIARRIFIRLTELGGETALVDTCRNVTFDELILKPDEAQAIQVVIKELADARLVTTSENTVQVAHEALIREWPTLRGWLEENREGLRLHRNLTQAAQDWRNAQCDLGMLYRGVRLAQVQEWAAAHGDDLNAQEREFLSASLVSSESEAVEREAQHRRELEAAQKLADTEKQRAEEGINYTHRLRRRSLVISVIGALAVVLAVVALFAWISSATQTARIRSVSLASAAQIANERGQADLALSLAMESIKIKQPPIEALNALRVIADSPGTRMLLRGHAQEVRAATLSPDAKVAFSGSCALSDDHGSCKQGELILWNLDNGKELRRWNAHTSWVTAVAISSDGQTLISGGEDGSLFLWDTNGNQIRQLVGHWGGISDLVAIANSDSLLSASQDGYLILWDMKMGHVLQRYAATENPIIAVSVAQDLSLVISANQNGNLKLWDLNKRQSILNFLLGYNIKSVALAPDGQWILITSSDTPGYYLRMISTTQGTLLHQQMFSCDPDDIAISPDQSYALITCSSAIIKMDLLNWSIQQRFSGQGEIFNTVFFDKDGQVALTASNDGSLRVWDMGEQLTYHIENINADALTSIDNTSDGRYLLLSDAEKDGDMRPALWDIAQQQVITTSRVAYDSFIPGGVKVSPDGRYAAVVNLTGIYYKNSGVTVWNIETGETLFTQPLFRSYVGVVVFSPDSMFLLVGSTDLEKPLGQLSLIDVETGKTLLKFDTTEDVSSVAFNSDGTQAISGSRFSGRVLLWDVKTGKEIRRFSYPDLGPISSVAFGPRDETILGAGLGELYLWDADIGSLIRTYSGLTTAPWSVAISKNGKYVLSGNEKGELILWDFTTGEELHREDFNTGIYSVLISPDEKTAYAASMEGKLIVLSISERSQLELLDWINANRYVFELTCAEKLQYHIPDPNCQTE